MSKQEKMLALVEDYKDSGLSGAAYSKKYGIHRSRLYYWIKKFNQTDSPSGFVYIKPLSPVSRTIEVNYSYGVSPDLSELVRSKDFDNNLSQFGRNC